MGCEIGGNGRDWDYIVGVGKRGVVVNEWFVRGRVRSMKRMVDGRVWNGLVMD